MTLIADVFPKLRTPKNMVRSMPKKSCFTGFVEKQHGKCPQTLFKFSGQPLYHIYWSLGSQMSYKKSLLVICKISKLFPNTLSAVAKYYLLDRDNLTQPNQMELSRKQKTLPQFFCSFLKSTLNFEHFQSKMTLTADLFPKLPTPKNMVRSMPKMSRFRGFVEKQHGKCTKTLFKFEGHPLSHIY